MKSTDGEGTTVSPPGPDPGWEADLLAALGPGPEVQVMRRAGSGDSRRVEVGTVPRDAVVALARSSGVMVTGPNAARMGYLLGIEDEAGEVWFLMTLGWNGGK
jgi:hypothetical protein